MMSGGKVFVLTISHCLKKIMKPPVKKTKSLGMKNAVIKEDIFSEVYGLTS